MRIEPAALAKAIGALDEVDLNRGLGPSVLQLMTMVKQLFDADAVGLMLVDAGGMLRWAAASDQQAEQLEQAQEALAQGPCTDAFWQRAPVPVRDVTREGRRGDRGGAAGRQVQGRPECAGGAGRWADRHPGRLRAERAALERERGQRSAGLCRLARQLQIALEHRVVIEQAKGALMEREGVDAAIAFERLRSSARSRHRTVVEVAGDVLAGVPLPSDPAGTIHQTTELAVIAYQQAAGLHERIAALYEQLGHPDRARQEWQRAAGARARAERAESERGSQDRPVAPWDSRLGRFCGLKRPRKGV